MEGPRHPLREARLAEFEHQIEGWLAAAGAQAAKLVVLAEADSCPCGVDLGLTDPPQADLSACLLEDLCSRGEEGQVLAAAGGGQSARLLCLRCPVAEEDTLILQVGFVAEGEALPEGARLARLAVPLLMWARTLLERRISEDSLQAELQQALSAQGEEREWIALEVHDRIAQTLASVFQQLQTLESMTREDQAARQVAVRASVLLREAIRESRNIMNDLHPPVLDEFGIDPLIREELRHFQEELSCRTRYTASYSVRPPRDMEVALYRIFHEALINVRRHASSARNVAVTLTSDRDTVNLQVQDDGPGFDIETALQRKRVGGLMSMRRRAEIIGGNLEVVSSPGSGTRVRVRVPLNGCK